MENIFQGFYVFLHFLEHNFKDKMDFNCIFIKVTININRVPGF